MARSKLLNLNPEPVAVVSDGRRAAWAPPRVTWRCDHEDGRGRCTSRETRTIWNVALRRAESYCAAHMPEGA